MTLEKTCRFRDRFFLFAPLRSLMNLTIDFGNTTIKTGVFDGRKLIHVEKHRKLSERNIISLLKRFEINRASSSSVIQSSKKAEEFLSGKIQLVRLLPTTSFPIRNFYESPKTLGMDRLANVIGAHSLFPKKNVLVISAGTCITYDVITFGAEYFGGNITPGLDMRLRSMHTFTSRLPLVKKHPTLDLFGRNTKDSMITGVIKERSSKLDGFISSYKKKYPSLKVILTGGDAAFFDGQLESKIFAVPHLVLHALNEILLFNDSQKV